MYIYCFFAFTINLYYDRMKKIKDVMRKNLNLTALLNLPCNFYASRNNNKEILRKIVLCKMS